MGNEELTVAGHEIPGTDVEWRFGPSGGPGGQHANRSNTRAELRFDLGASEVFRPDLRRRMLERLGRRATGGVVTVVVDDSRSQWRNRALARQRLVTLLEDAMKQPPTRRPTRPTRSSRTRRRADKQARSETKRLRRPPESE